MSEYHDVAADVERFHTKRHAGNVGLFIGLGLVLFGLISNQFAPTWVMQVFGVIGVVVILACLAVVVLNYRCPFCGKFVRLYPINGVKCGSCGQTHDEGE